MLVIGDAPPSGTESWYDDRATTTRRPRPPEVDIDIERDLIALPYSERHDRPAEGRDAQRTATWCAITCSARRPARITERDVLLLFLPFYHIYGTMLMGASIASGATVCIMERFDAMTALAITQRYGVTLFYAVPPVLLALTPDARSSRSTISRRCATS
mgnify:CR=1 FL=1